MIATETWFEQWKALPTGMRHLLYYCLYSVESGDDGVECVLTTRAFSETKPLEVSRHWEVFNVRDGLRALPWVPAPEGIFDQLVAEVEGRGLGGGGDDPSWRVVTPSVEFELSLAVAPGYPSVYAPLRQPPRDTRRP